MSVHVDDCGCFACVTKLRERIAALEAALAERQRAAQDYLTAYNNACEHRAAIAAENARLRAALDGDKK